MAKFSVNAYAVIDNMTYPLMFKVFKPRTRLKQGEQYKSKPQLATLNYSRTN